MSIADKLTRLSAARDDIIDALGNKGVTATDHGIEDFATDIASITGGGAGGIVITDTTDTAGGTIRTITAAGNIATKTASDLTASGATVTVPAGYYASQATKSVTSGSATTPATTITANPTISVNSSTGVITASNSKTQSVTPTVSAGYISSGTAGTITVSGSNTSNLSTQAAQTIYPSTSDQTISSGKYLTGTQTVKGVLLTNLSAGNIKKDVVVKVGDSADDDRITSITGTYEGGGGSSKNVQYVMDSESVHTNGYTSTGMSITVAKTGTYNVSWVGWRSSSQGTMGTNLYKNGTAGTNQQTFTNTYGQFVTLTNQSYTQGDVLTLYATAGSTTRYMWVANLIIEEQ